MAVTEIIDEIEKYSFKNKENFISRLNQNFSDSELFECRTLLMLLKCSNIRNIEYEFKAIIDDDSSVDFKFENQDGNVFLLELTNLNESKEVSKQTITDEEGFFLYTSLTDHNNVNSSETLEIIKAQSALIKKVSRGINPIKFPERNKDQYNVIVINIDNSNKGTFDQKDCQLICYGNYGIQQLHPKEYRYLVRSFKDKENRINPIFGIFEGDHPQAGTEFIRDRIDSIIFVKSDTNKFEYPYIMMNPKFWNCNNKQDAKEIFKIFNLYNKSHI